MRFEFQTVEIFHFEALPLRADLETKWRSNRRIAATNEEDWKIGKNDGNLIPFKFSNPKYLKIFRELDDKTCFSWKLFRLEVNVFPNFHFLVTDIIISFSYSISKLFHLLITIIHDISVIYFIT